jgi:hypothetical protein
MRKRSELLKELKKRGWRKMYEDNYSLVFEHKTFGVAVFDPTMSDELILKSIKNMEEESKK